MGNLLESLFVWLKTFQLGTGAHRTPEDLCDGVCLAHVLSQIAPEHFNSAWLNTIAQANLDNWQVRQSNIERIMAAIENFHAAIGSPISPAFRRPDSTLISKNFDRRELGRLLQLILSCAANCTHKEYFLRIMLGLENEAQVAVKQALEDLHISRETAKPADPSQNSDELFTLRDNLRRTSEELIAANEAKDRAIQQYFDIKRELDAISAERDQLRYENESLVRKLQMAENTRAVGQQEPSDANLTDISKLQVRIESLQGELLKLESSKEEYRLKNEQLESELNELKLRNDEGQSKSGYQKPQQQQPQQPQPPQPQAPQLPQQLPQPPQQLPQPQQQYYSNNSQPSRGPFPQPFPMPAYQTPNQAPYYVQQTASYQPPPKAPLPPPPTGPLPLAPTPGRVDVIRRQTNLSTMQPLPPVAAVTPFNSFGPSQPSPTGPLSPQFQPLSPPSRPQSTAPVGWNDPPTASGSISKPQTKPPQRPSDPSIYNVNQYQQGYQQQTFSPPQPPQPSPNNNFYPTSATPFNSPLVGQSARNNPSEPASPALELSKNSISYSQPAPNIFQPGPPMAVHPLPPPSYASSRRDSPPELEVVELEGDDKELFEKFETLLQTVQGQLTKAPLNLRRKADDVTHKLNVLKVRLAHSSLTAKTKDGLKQIADSIDRHDYANGLQVHAAIVTSTTFSVTSAFLPAIKVLLHLAQQYVH